MSITNFEIEYKQRIKESMMSHCLKKIKFSYSIETSVSFSRKQLLKYQDPLEYALKKLGIKSFGNKCTFLGYSFFVGKECYATYEIECGDLFRRAVKIEIEYI